MLRILPTTCAALFFLSAALTVATPRRALAQVVPPSAAPSTPEPAKLSQTYIQIDGASLVAAAAALGGTLAAGIRSAAGVVTRYMGAQTGKHEARELAQAKTIETLATIVANYYADRKASVEAIEDLSDDLETLAEAFADLAGKPKPRRRTRKPKPPPLPSTPDDTAQTAAV